MESPDQPRRPQTASCNNNNARLSLQRRGHFAGGGSQLEAHKVVSSRSRRLTVCLLCLVAAISCKSPFLSMHLMQRVGLLLFESDLLQLKASIYSVIICLLVLVILHSILVMRISAAAADTNNRDQQQRSSGALHRKGNRNPANSLTAIQNNLRQLISLFAFVSALAYLSISLIVPQVRQIQRMPIATFDCNANLITIENCHQQFTTKGGEQTITEAIGQMLAGDVSDSSGGGGEPLIKKLNCLKYNDNELETLQVPTRFLLHKCGLVCRPQRQQLHQFGDDLNREQSSWPQPPPPIAAEFQAEQPRLAKTTVQEDGVLNKQTVASNRPPLVPPYHSDRFSSATLTEDHPATTTDRRFIYHNASSPIESSNSDKFTSGPAPSLTNGGDAGSGGSSSSSSSQVSLRVCFSGEFSGGSNYKKFCITNLANNGHGLTEQTLTVGQLNAMLRSFVPPPGSASSSTLQEPLLEADSGGSEGGRLVDRTGERRHGGGGQQQQHLNDDQATHYVNPVVQFESHFKNWPHLPSSSLVPGADSDDDDDEQGWCKFRPIPPFIVNNKPFSDIQCSLEHEYIMTTEPPPSSRHLSSSSSSSFPRADKIYLKKSNIDDDGSSSSPADSGGDSYSHRERCNIQCKVNILYQIHSKSHGGGGNRSSRLPRKAGENSRATAAGNTNTNNNHDHQTAEDYSAHFYLPLKPCLIVYGDKIKTTNYYLLFRSIGDSTLTLVFILLDMFLLLESIDTKQSQLEGKRLRLVGLLLAISLTPLLVALLFDLVAAHWSPAYYNLTERALTRREGYLISFVTERIWPSFMELLYPPTSSSSSKSPSNKQQHQRSRQNFTGSESEPSAATAADRHRLAPLIIDNYMLPFFIYSVLMFSLAIVALKLPVVPSKAYLVRVASTEELGMANIKPSAVAARNRNKLATALSKTPAKLERETKEKLPTSSATVVGHKLQETTGAGERGPAATSAQKHGGKAATPWSAPVRKLSTKMISFLLVTLLMGTQFNLSQLTQTQILFDTFGNPALPSGPQVYTALWFTLATHSGAALFVLLLALLFADEASSFLANFSPFKLTATQYAATNSLESRRRRAMFLRYLSIPLLVYAFRYFVLSRMSAASRFKWPVVFLFQVAELFNFPLTWFTLTTRAHEILMELLSRATTEQPTKSGGGSNNGGHHQQRALPPQQKVPSTPPPSSPSPTQAALSRAKELHLIVQSCLAFTYFALARSLALFIHSLYASLHLHSDNVDWFITNFYRPQQSTGSGGGASSSAGSFAMVKQTNSMNGTATSTTTPTASSSSSPNIDDNSSGQFAAGAKPTAAESLFSPLPSERQTYLHATRLFLRYNALVCLAIGAALLVNLIYVRYQIWAEQRRSLEQAYSARPASASRGATPPVGRLRPSDPMDERLTLDLMQLQSGEPTTRTILPSQREDVTAGGDRRPSSRQRQSPRAKILYHYDLGRRLAVDDSSDSASLDAEATDDNTLSESVLAAREPSPPLSPPLRRPADAAGVELRIPIEIEREVSDEGSDESSLPQAKEDEGEPAEFIERVVHQRNKRVRVFEDEEVWPHVDVVRSERTTLGADDHEGSEHFAGADVDGDDDDDVNVDHAGPAPRSYVAQPSKETMGAWHSRNRADDHRPPAQEPQLVANKKQRTITFAPTATLIGSDSGSGSQAVGSRHLQRRPQQQRQLQPQLQRPGPRKMAAQRASPEPSIDNESDYGNDIDSIENR